MDCEGCCMRMMREVMCRRNLCSTKECAAGRWTEGSYKILGPVVVEEKIHVSNLGQDDWCVLITIGQKVQSRLACG